MATMPVFGSGTSRHTHTHGLEQRLEILERAVRKHAVTEVEDVAWASGCTQEHLARPLNHTLGRAEQHRRVEVALDAAIVADALPARVEVDAPVERDDVRSRGCDQFEQARGRGPKVDPRNAECARGF